MEKFCIDDITWHDLNMDDVLERTDRSSSSVGKEYTAKALRTLEFDEEILKKRGRRADYLKENKADADTLRKLFKNLGRTRKISFYDYIFRLKELENGSNALHYILIVLLLLAAALIFVNPVFGIIALVVMISVNISVYFKKKAKIEGYFLSLKYLVSMISCAENVLKKAKPADPAFEDICSGLKSASDELKGLKRGSWLLTNSVSGSLVDVVMDYIRMIFHVDIIRFNQMRKKALGHENEINLLYSCLGELELALNICGLRDTLQYYCEPSFKDAVRINAEDIYHPLVDDPVSNSINTQKSVLFTGSNASGKSTFLKTIALNQIFAQTIYTCLAYSYETGFFKVLSSMALSDNILGKESYFVVEIKSLKRIFDELSDVPVLCFIDEVLRGTNTKERIAASSQILKSLASDNALVFAATHDIELTQILEDEMENMHFSETVNDREVLFDYKLKKGAANSRNAIKLLEVYGFDEKITQEALKMCLP